MNKQDYIFKMHVKQDKYACVGFFKDKNDAAECQIYLVTINEESNKVNDVLFEYYDSSKNIYYNKPNKIVDVFEFLIETERLNIPRDITNTFINRMNLMKNRK
jgi:hypothetical protein